MKKSGRSLNSMKESIAIRYLRLMTNMNSISDLNLDRQSYGARQTFYFLSINEVFDQRSL